MTSKKTIIIAAIALILGILIRAAIAHAGFINDWITQKTESSPGYFEGQKRGYVTGGSFSARWPMRNDHLVTFEPPRLKVGCGGIDAFMGGFSFMNFDLLVEKLQRILQNAPAAAFELALKNLCEPCANVMNALEDISNSLNGLQLNDCQSSKVLAARIMTNFTDNPKIRDEAQKEFQLETGVSNLYHSITSAIKSEHYEPQVNDERQMFTGCVPEFNQIFLAGDVGQSSSILQAIGELRGYSQEYIEFMRGLVGDIQIVYNQNPSTGRITINHHLISPCPQNANLSLDAVYNGDVWKKAQGEDTACTQVLEVSMRDWAWTTVKSIADKMRNKQVLTAGEDAFVEQIPAIYASLKVAILTGQENAVFEELSELAAKAYVQMSMQDFYGGIRQSLSIARTVLSKSQNPEAGSCHIDMIAPIDGNMRELMDHAFTLASQTREDYVKFVNEHTALLNMAQKYEDFNKLAKDKLSKSFTPSLAVRATGGM